MPDEAQNDKKRAAWLVPYHFKPGNDGGGSRKPLATTLRQCLGIAGNYTLPEQIIDEKTRNMFMALRGEDGKRKLTMNMAVAIRAYVAAIGGKSDVMKLLLDADGKARATVAVEKADTLAALSDQQLEAELREAQDMDAALDAADAATGQPGPSNGQTIDAEYTDTTPPTDKDAGPCKAT